MSRSLPLRRPRRLDACIALLSGLALEPSLAQQNAAAPRASVATTTRTYALPPAPLATTLSAIADLSGVPVKVDAAAMANLNSAAVNGELTARQAVILAIQSTGMSVSDDGQGGLVVGAGELAPVFVTAKRDPAETSFKADRSDTATRSGTDMMDVPASVTIVTGKVLESQQTTSLRDALRNVSGINFKDSPQGAPAFAVRGFDETSLTTNGVVDTSAVQTNVYGIERVEVLKGPQAILAGGDSLGGGVNVVLKRPSAERVRDVTVQYGTHADRTVAADFSGAFSEENKQITFRLIGATARASTNDAGFDGRKDDFLMPELRWKNEWTDLTAGASVGEQHANLPLYTFARRDGTIVEPPSTRPGNAGDGFDFRQKRVFYELEQKVATDVALVSRLQYASTLQFLHLYTPLGLGYAAGAPDDMPNGRVSFAGTPDRATRGTTSGDHYLRAKFELGPVSQKLSVGVNHTDVSSNQTQFGGAATVVANLYPPAPVTFPDVQTSNPMVISVNETHSSQRGVFVQDLLTWGDWNLQLNFRRTLYTQSGQLTSYTRTRVRTTVTPETTIDHNTPGAGVVYNLNDQTALYASYSEGFVARTSLSCDGGLVPPLLSRNKEVGAKFQFFDRKLSLTSALYQLEQSDTLVFDSLNRCYTSQPSSKTTGLEVDLQGEVARGWNALLNYTHSTIKDLGDATTIYPGNPKNKINLWTTYDLPWPALQGFGVGVGLTAQSKSDGTSNVDTPFTLPGQAQFDATVFYRRPKWDIALGVKNLFDRRLYGDSSSGTYIPILQGRSFLLTVKHGF